jgi:hypothetical protein
MVLEITIIVFVLQFELIQIQISLNSLVKCKSSIGSTKVRTLGLSPRPMLLAKIPVLAKMIAGLVMMIGLARTIVLARMTVAAKTGLVKTTAGTKMTALLGATMMSVPGATTMSSLGAMMMSALDAMMMTAVVIASLHPMWTPLARFSLFMDTLPVTAGGAMEMIEMVTVDRRGQTLPPMALIQIGIMILVPRITLLAS